MDTVFSSFTCAHCSIELHICWISCELKNFPDFFTDSNNNDNDDDVDNNNDNNNSNCDNNDSI